jgi:hypothetical protein
MNVKGTGAPMSLPADLVPTLESSTTFTPRGPSPSGQQRAMLSKTNTTMSVPTMLLRKFDARAQSDKLIRLAWIDEAKHVKCVSGRCFEVTNRMIRVESSERIPLHTRVLLRAPGMGMAGAASVKYVTNCVNTFILVLDIGE